MATLSQEIMLIIMRLKSQSFPFMSGHLPITLVPPYKAGKNPSTSSKYQTIPRGFIHLHSLQLFAGTCLKHTNMLAILLLVISMSSPMYWTSTAQTGLVKGVMTQNMLFVLTQSNFHEVPIVLLAFLQC